MISAATSKFLKTNKNLLINGKWVPSVSGKTFDTVNPANGSTLIQVANSNSVDVDLAVKAARDAFNSKSTWRRMPVNERGRLLHRVGDLILRNADELAELESIDNGKPVTVAKVADVALAADMFHYMSGFATKIHGRTFENSIGGLLAPGSRFLTSTIREPIGVIGQVIPFNFPLLMCSWKLAPALTAGNTVVLKPAEQTPLTALRLGELLQEAGLPDGVVNIITGFGDAGAAIAAHPDVDKVAFTGSTEVGKLIIKASAGNLKKVSLELGGKSPNIVFKDAALAPGGLKAAISNAASSIFFNQGQTCCAGSRLFVERSVFEEVVDGVSKRAQIIKVGDGMQSGTQMGPLVSSEQYNRVRNFLKQAIADGAHIKAGGLEHPANAHKSGFFVKPTVITNTKPHMSVVREEIFGPVVVAEPFDDYDDLVRRVNDTDYGLAAGVFTSDISKAHQLAADIRAGTVWINCYNMFDAALPFGGYKQSGWGREMGPEVVDSYTEVKSVCIRL